MTSLRLIRELKLLMGAIHRRDWVGKCMAQMVDSNRAEAQAEMKTIIAQAHSNQTLWTTDWAGIQLQRCAHPSSHLANLAL